MKALKDNAGSLIMSVLEILVGILLLIKPMGFTAGIIIAAGVLLVLNGCYSILKYIKAEAFSAAHEHNMALGLLSIALGGFCIFQSPWIIATFPMLTVVYGVGIFVTGLYKIQFSIDLFRMERQGWGWAALSAVVSVLFAVMILMNPFSSTVALWTFTAVTLIVEAILDIVYVIMRIRKEKKATVYVRNEK